MTIFISGSISNDLNYKEHFGKVEMTLEKLGYRCINPVEKEGVFTYKQYIDIGLSKLSCCDAIIMLDGWESSAGARLEHAYAKTVGMTIVYEKELMSNG